MGVSIAPEKEDVILDKAEAMYQQIKASEMK